MLGAGSFLDRLTPLLGAVLVGFLLTTLLHEFLHAYVAYLGGDRSEYNRLQLRDPLTYLDPLTSVVFPLVFVLLGGLPLMGGSVMIRRDLIRSDRWRVAMDLAGVVGNFAVFVVCGLLLTYFPWDSGSQTQENIRLFLGALAFLQLFCVLLNLTPVPGFDGFHALTNFLPPHQREAMFNPQARLLGMIIFFVILWNTEFASMVYFPLMGSICGLLQIDHLAMVLAFQSVLFGV